MTSQDKRHFLCETESRTLRGEGSRAQAVLSVARPPVPTPREEGLSQHPPVPTPASAPEPETVTVPRSAGAKDKRDSRWPP